MKKIKSAIGSVIGGLICVVIGIALLIWNEGNDVKNIKTIEEATASLINVKSDKIDPSNEGKLISTNGTMKVIDESLSDEYFNVSVPGTSKLVRIVEMYQWVEECETKDEKTICTYSKEWLSTLNDSDTFEESGHDNPDVIPYEGETYYANEVELGAFKLSATQIQMLDATEQVMIDESTVFLPNDYNIIDNYITDASKMNEADIGDVRVSFKYNNDTEITVLAMQKGDTFDDFVSKQDKVLNVLQSGILSGEEMINIVETQNNIIKWVLRSFGVLLVCVGFLLFLTPVLELLSIIPLVGKGIAGILKTVAFLIGLAVSMLVIALSWIVFRPLLGICLLAAVVGIIVLIVVLIKKGRSKAALEQTQGNVTQQPVAPVQQPVAPVQQPVMPVQQPVASVQQPVMPVQQPVTPVQQVQQPETIVDINQNNNQ